MPRKVYNEEKDIETSPLVKGYAKFIRGVDVANQMLGAYSSQIQSHKWWHQIFFFLLDMVVMNCYILYEAICEKLQQDPIYQINFHLTLVEPLCKLWIKKRGCVS